MHLTPPPLPSQWPYAPRETWVEPEARTRVELPGLPGLWSLEAMPGLAFPEPGRGLGQAFGRGGVLRAGPVVLRPYRRGGLVRHVNAAVYCGTGRSGPPACPRWNPWAGPTGPGSGAAKGCS
jgi:hypothetical protein